MTDTVKPSSLSTSEAGTSQQQGSEPHDLQRREETLAEREIEMALSEAQLRGQEAHVAALGAALSTRGAWIDGQVDQIAAWASRAGVDAAHMLHGLGGGAATQEADLKRYVQRSETLLIGRAAMIATRAEVLQRRVEQLADRASELQAFEQAFVRAEVRLTARERLLREALSELQRTASGDVAPKLEPTPAAAEAWCPSASVPCTACSLAGDTGALASWSPRLRARRPGRRQQRPCGAWPLRATGAEAPLVARTAAPSAVACVAWRAELRGRVRGSRPCAAVWPPSPRRGLS